jgi:serine/threonine-protein kinase
MRADLDSEIEHERFRAERQILASLNHPNIARLLDGGVTESGVHYLVLEYVDGKQIDIYCDEHGLDVRQRVALFLSVIDGTAHAHRNLVVHRDLKPSNVFITADGTVKLLDFGLAKLLESQDSNRTARTTLPGRRWMTPEYAAPEQIMGALVTTLTDVYQLGATLYELLAGVPPFGRRDGNLQNLQQSVVKTDPDPPSAQAYELRRRALRGDLDAIVLKALRKEPEQRYASAQALADDLRKYLSGHPVAARRQTAAYRAVRFARRHRALLLGTLAIAIVLGAYITTVTIDRIRIRSALNEATAGTHKAEQVTDFMLGLFDESQAGQSFSDTITARALLNRGLSRAQQLSELTELSAIMVD